MGVLNSLFQVALHLSSLQEEAKGEAAAQAAAAAVLAQAEAEDLRAQVHLEQCWTYIEKCWTHLEQCWIHLDSVGHTCRVAVCGASGGRSRGDEDLRAQVCPSTLRLLDSCITQLKAQGPSSTCNESKEEEEEDAGRDGRSGFVQDMSRTPTVFGKRMVPRRARM